MSGLPEVELQHVCARISVGLAMAVTPYMTEAGVKLIRNQNIKPNKFDDTSIVYVDPGFAASKASKRIRGGDVVIVRTGANIGDSCVVPEVFDGAQSFTTLVVRPDQNRLCPRYLAQFINSHLGRAEVQRLMAGGGKGNLNSGELERFRITLPSRQEQEHIASLLTVWDSSVEIAEQLVAAKESYFTTEKSRLIVYHRRRVGISNRRRRLRDPQSRTTVLGEILTESRNPETEPDGARRLTVRLHLQGVESRIVRESESDGETTYFRRRAGQLIYGKQNVFRGAIGIIPPNLDGYSSTQDLPSFDIAPSVDPRWLFHWLARKSFYESLESLAAGSGSKRLHADELFKVPITLPDLARQTAIARYLDALRHEIVLLGLTLDVLKAQKRGLMQKLLTGQWRLPLPEEEAV